MRMIDGSCAECRHWSKRVEADLGTCQRFWQPGSGVVISTSDRVPQLITRADFGCVQWERRVVEIDKSTIRFVPHAE